jgi:hypothetical protein
MMVNKRTADAMIGRNGGSSDFGVLFITGRVVIFVNATVFLAVFTGTGVEIAVCEGAECLSLWILCPDP